MFVGDDSINLKFMQLEIWLATYVFFYKKPFSQVLLSIQSLEWEVPLAISLSTEGSRQNLTKKQMLKAVTPLNIQNLPNTS